LVVDTGMYDTVRVGLISFGGVSKVVPLF